MCVTLRETCVPDLFVLLEPRRHERLLLARPLLDGGAVLRHELRHGLIQVPVPRARTAAQGPGILLHQVCNVWDDYQAKVRRFAASAKTLRS